ncbi:MAG: hypothetical protein K0Q68_587 [Moraxellaceae bacterium]|jgi:hypothetical protein|nr:hypothetical protein [Moraxellaceae bacterium]
MKNVVVGILALALAGCAPLQIKNQLVPFKDQKIEFFKGAPYASSSGAASEAILLLKDKQSIAGNRVQLNIAAFNTGQTPFNFGVENITVRSSSGEQLELVPYEQIASEIQAEIERQRRVASYMAYQAMTAKTKSTTQNYGNFSGSSNFSANTYGSGGYANTTGNVNGYGTYSGQSTTTTVNPAQNAAAANAWLARGDAARAELESRLGAVSESYLQTNTVRPSNSVEGYVYLTPSQSTNPKQPDTYTVSVVIGGDTHIFTIQRTPQK